MTWATYKQSLCNEKYLHECFLESTQEIIRQSIAKSYKPSQPNPYIPRLYDLYLGDLATLSDRMALYRKEMRELEILAVSAATERRMHLASRSFERTLAKLQLGKEISERKAELAKDVASKFDPTIPLGTGFRTDAIARQNISALEANSASQELTCLTSRWDLADQINDETWTRFNEPGNAHNYCERWQWAKRLLIEDAQEALQKALAVSVGIQTVLGMSASPLPDETSKDFVEEFTLWTRAIFREMEIEDQTAQEFGIVVPLVQPILPGGRSIIDPNTFKQEIAKAKATPDGALELAFTLPELLLPQETKTQLRSIALSFSTESDIVDDTGIDRSAQRLAYARLQAELELPEQSHRGDAAGTLPRAYVGEVFVYGSSQGPAFITSKQIRNADITGQWRIKVMPRAVYQDSLSCEPLRGIDGYQVKDIKLHLRGVRKL